MHLILTGATGMVGSAVLNTMIRDPAVSKVSILSRKPVAQATDTPEATSKCTVHTYEDFSKLPSSEILDQLRGAKGVVWALGVSVTDVPKEEYEVITKQYPLAFAKSFSTLNGADKFNFVYVSGEGATTSPGKLPPRFGAVKGQTEAALLALGKQSPYSETLRVYSARPGGVDAKHQPEIHKYFYGRLPWYKEATITPLAAILRNTYKSIMSPTRELGDALVQLAKGDGEALPPGPGIDGEGRIVSNVALRKMAGI